jgi:hypothetical protein
LLLTTKSSYSKKGKDTKAFLVNLAYESIAIDAMQTAATEEKSWF